MSNLQALFEQRNKAHAEYKAVLAEAHGSDGLTAERQAKLDTIDANITQITAQIRAMQVAEARDAEFAASQFDASPEGKEKRADADADARAAGDVFGTEEYRKNFLKYLRSTPAENMRGAHVDYLARTQVAQTTVAAEGGHTIPTSLANRIIETMKFYSNLLNLVTLETTTSGNPIDFPTEDSTAAIGALIGEGATDTVGTQAYGKKTLGAYMFTSRVFKISWELMQDSAFNIEARIARIAGMRLGRIMQQMMTTGTGTNQPEGVVTAATVGKTAASQTAITYPEIIDLIHSVDPAYRPNATLMFNDVVLAALKKLVDADGRPLWSLSTRDGEPDRFAGVPYQVNTFMANPAAGVKSILYGDFAGYTARLAGGIQLLRLDELFALERQIGLAAYQRADGKLLDGAAIRAFQQAAAS